MLGLGGTSRIGFWLWYVVPISALLVGQASLGALIFGAYGLTRGGMVWPIILGGSRRFEGDTVAQWLLGHREPARVLAATQLIVVGVVAVLVVGL